MTISEFDLIDKFFRSRSKRRPGVVLGIGDDCALLEIPPGRLLAVTADTLLSGVHFLADTDPGGLGHKALAVNLSDLAAMGATPAWLTLSLTLPEVDEIWLDAFATGFLSLADEHGAVLVGGDMSRGPLSITVQAHGLVPTGGGLRRSGARPGDAVLITGTVGDAGLGLEIRQGSGDCGPVARDYLCQRLERPTPRVSAGIALLPLASAAIDVSDGLAQDLNHILEASAVGASLFLDALPLSEALQEVLSVERGRQMAMTAGDDYELCFTCPREQLETVKTALHDSETRVTEIGVIEAQKGLRVVDGSEPAGGRLASGYRHF